MVTRSVNTLQGSRVSDWWSGWRDYGLVQSRQRRYAGWFGLLSSFGAVRVADLCLPAAPGSPVAARQGLVPACQLPSPPVAARQGADLRLPVCKRPSLTRLRRAALLRRPAGRAELPAASAVPSRLLRRPAGRAEPPAASAAPSRPGAELPAAPTCLLCLLPRAARVRNPGHPAPVQSPYHPS